MFEKKFCQNCKVVQLFGYQNYCRVCSENYQDYLSMIKDKESKHSKFKQYVEDNVLSKINSKVLLMEARRKQIERLDNDRFEESRIYEQLKRIRDEDDPLPRIID